MTQLEVKRITTEATSHIEPPLNPKWSPLQKLQWKAAVQAIDTGEEIFVDKGRCTIAGIPQPGYYGISMSGFGAGPFRFNDAWDWLNGFGVGGGRAKVRTERAIRSLLAAADELDREDPLVIAGWLRREARDIAKQAGVEL